ncbi:MAG: FKBP-type peptidyl-prolyl cis-trans isomerase [Armatimonadota bacterium]
MAQASDGDTVKVHYTGKLEDGTVFDSSREREPIEFTIDEGEVIPGFEDAVRGMEEGETRTVEIAPEQGYGPRQENAIFEVQRDQIPDEIEPEVGMQLQVQGQDRQPFAARVAEVGDETVTLDANHPLAGETLTFDLELVEIA